MSEEEYIDDLDYITGIVKQNKKLIEENVQLHQENKQLKEENKQLKEDKKKAREYIYLHSTQRKMFANVSDRLHNQEIQFKGRIEDLLEILEVDE